MTKIYRSLQGRQIDIDKLRTQNELMPAVGNMRVNARGDELGPGGKIVRTREQIMAEYYEANPNAVPDPEGKGVQPTVSKSVPKQPTQTTSVPPTQTLKVEDTPVEEVIEEIVPPKEEVVAVEQAEAEVVEKATEAVQKARARRRSGIADATGE